MVRFHQRLFVALTFSGCLFLALAAHPAAASTDITPGNYQSQMSLALYEVQLSPKSPRPGDVVIAQVRADPAAQVVGQMDERLVHFGIEDDLRTLPQTGAQPAISATYTLSTFVALIGLDALTHPGVYTLTITITQADGSTQNTAQPFRVVARSSFIEYVTLSKSLAATLDPIANADETRQLNEIYSVYSEPKWYSAPFRMPVNGRFAALYGNRRIYNGINLGTYHSGYDIVAGKGAPVKASAPGRVIAIRTFIAHGLSVILDHGHGVFTTYSHLSKALVAEGQMVDTGDVIGAVGTTGRSQGPHLHFELAVGGAPVDPGVWLRSTLP
jgi:murein DD-endopeptidase MepM/ murein hydrolase activator NlpD